MPEHSKSFGPELRRVRLGAGISLTRFAGLVHYSKGYLSKVENGQKQPTVQLARLCDAVLKTNELSELLLREKQTHIPIPGQESEAWLMRLGGDGSGEFSLGDPVPTSSGAEPVMAFSPPGSREAAGAEQHTVEAAHALFAQYRRLGQATSPAFVLPGLVAQAHGLEQMAARSGGRTREALLTVAARFAEYTGWMAQEAGDDRAALWWTDRAAQLAAAGGDQAFATYSLVRRGLVSLLRGDIAQGIELAGHALESRTSARIRGLAAQHQAQGHALAGDHRRSMRSLDLARTLLDEDDEAVGASVVGASHLPDVVSMFTGWCLFHLGRPMDAADVYARETACIPEHAIRSRTRYGIQRALALAAAGEIDHACDVMDPLLGQIAMVHSATILADLRRMRRVLIRHPRNVAATALAAQIAAALSTP